MGSNLKANMLWPFFLSTPCIKEMKGRKTFETWCFIQELNSLSSKSKTFISSLARLLIRNTLVGNMFTNFQIYENNKTEGNLKEPINAPNFCS
jgi:hypothetical protein